MKSTATLRHFLCIASSALLCISSAALHAQTAWDGGALTTDYATALNWAGDIIPGNGNANGALIGSSATNTVIYNTATSYTSNGTGKANSLLVGTGTNGVGSLTLSGSAGTLTFGGDAYNNAAWIGSTIGISNATGTVTVSAGKLAIGSALGTDASINLGVSIDTNPTGTKSGTLIIDGGTVEVGRRILLGANAVTAAGVFTISSGTLNMRRTGSNGENDNGMIRLGTGNNTVNLDGGTAILSGIHLFDATNLRSNIYFNGTTLRANVANADFIKGSTAGNSVANANLQIKNGGLIFDTNNFAVTINDTLSNFTGHTGFLRKEGLSTLTLSAANTYSGATDIKNGMLALGAGNDRLPTGTTVTLGDGVTNNNGILKLDSRSQQLAGLLTAGSGTGNRVVNGNATAATLTLNTASGTNTFGGILGGTGTNENNFALTKSGGGILALSGVNTYTGGTTVSDGTLTLGNASALGSASASITGGSLDLGGQTVANAVSIGASGTLTGSGSTGAATLAGSVTPGGSSSGLITMASASVASTSAIALQLAATGTRGVNYDALTVSAPLALDGTITVSLNGLTPANGQSFDLIDSTGSIDVTNFTVATDLVLPALGGGLVWDTSDFVSNGIVSIATAGGDPYATWAGAAVFDQDDNNDGVANGLAWLLGAGSPSENATGRLPVVTQTGGNLELSFTCLKIAGRGTNLLNLQYSKDLGITDPWTNHEVSVPDAAGVVGSVTFTVPSLNGDPTLVDLKASIPASEAAPGTKLFGRLMAVKQP